MDNNQPQYNKHLYSVPQNSNSSAPLYPDTNINNTPGAVINPKNIGKGLKWDGTTLSTTGSVMRAYKSAALQTVGGGVTALLVLDAVTFDNNNQYNASTSTFTAVNTGYYQVSGALLYNNVEDQKNYYIHIYKNGGIVTNIEVNASGAGNDESCHVTDIIQLNVGDTINLYTTNNGVGAKTVFNNSIYTYLSIAQVA